MVRVRKSLDEILRDRRKGAERAYDEGKPSNLKPEQRKKWKEAH